MRTVCCQTEIEGIDQILFKPEQINAYYNWMSQMTVY
jgi:hypothetical protein